MPSTSAGAPHIPASTQNKAGGDDDDALPSHDLASAIRGAAAAPASAGNVPLTALQQAMAMGGLQMQLNGQQGHWKAPGMQPAAPGAVYDPSSMAAIQATMNSLVGGGGMFEGTDEEFVYSMLLVVRAAKPAATSPVCFKLSTNSYFAYNNW